jgi:hypothetical protein
MKSWRSVKVTARGQSKEKLEVSQSYTRNQSNEELGSVKVTAGIKSMKRWRSVKEQLEVSLMKRWTEFKVTARGQSNEELEISQSYS